MISAISKQVFRIFDYAEYFLFKTLLFGLGWTISCKLTLHFIWPVCLRFYVLFGLFGDTIQVFVSYGLLFRNSLLVFS